MKLPVYIKIDLTSQIVTEYPISEKLFTKYIGGKILGGKLLYDLFPAGTDALAPESVLILNTGPVNGTGAPSSSRFSMSFKNVMTGGVASSNCGGSFGMHLKRAGFDGLILVGRAEHSVFIEILDGNIAIKDATSLIGLDAEETQEKFDKHWGKLVIGPAGEHMVRYACAISGERVAGRCGAGAVLGSKNVKAIVAYGTRKPPVAEQEKFDAYVKKWVRFLKNHPMTGHSLPTYGTAGLVSSANASGALPTKNFLHGRYEKSRDIAGETLADTKLTRNSGCISCPIRCARRVMVDGKEVKGPEFETVGLFGSNIENNDFDFISDMNYYADIWGMDTISLAGTIAFAMELQEKGLADFGLHFGDTEGLKDVIWKIAHREGIYSELANGSKWLSEKYGGKDFAIHAKGLELASYEPRHSVGMGLGYATANRGGCHLNGGYLALFESVGIIEVDRQTPKGKAELTVMFQNMMEAVSACGFCLFTCQSVVPAFLFRLGPRHLVTKIVNRVLIGVRAMLRPIWWLMPGLLSFNTMYLMPQSAVLGMVTGIKMTTGKLMQIGERGYNTERLFSLREGLTSADDSLPKRLTDELQEPDKPDSRVPLDKMLPMYYKVRGWDHNGVPTKQKRKQLGLPMEG